MLIIGDAAHAMVPFYGQGMNCGFEDVSVLASILKKHGIHGTGRPDPVVLETALDEYTRTRSVDAHAMCDLAMHNYVEMRKDVVKGGGKGRSVVKYSTHYLSHNSLHSPTNFANPWNPCFTATYPF